MYNYAFIVFTLTLIFLHGISSIELQSYSACYGTTGLSNFLLPTCGSGKIAPMGVYIYAKTLETNCPVTIDFLNQGTTNASCCEYDPEDCETLYQGSVYREYYQRCNGQPSCTIQVSWIPTPCDQDVYLERTNYMKMDFYCISDQALDTCENLVATDSPTFLWNSGYPSSPMSGSTCSCSVEVDCETTITITAIDLRLESSGGECKQAIVIEDGGSTVSFDCSSNNDYLPTVLYTSTSHFIEISINNELGTTGGYYFISVQGTNPSGSIRLACGTTSQASPNTESSLLPVCPSSVSTTTASTTSETTPSSNRSSTMTISPSTVQTTLVDSSTVSENTIVSSTYNTVIQNTDSVATTDDAVTQDTTIHNTNSATDPVTTASSMMTDMLTKYDTNMLTSSTTTGRDMSATALISTTVTSATGSTISSTMSTDGTTALKSSYLANMSTMSGFNTMFITTDGSLFNQTWPLQTNTNNLSNIVSADISPTFTSLRWSSTESPAMSSAVHPSGCCINRTETGKKSGVTTESSNSTWIAAIVVIVVVIGVIVMVILYREKIKECCSKKKAGEMEEDVIDEKALFGNFVPMGKAGALPPLEHTHTIHRENTLGLRPLSPIKSNVQKVRTTLNMNDDLIDDSEFSVFERSTGKMQRNTSLPPIQHSIPTRTSSKKRQLTNDLQKHAKTKLEKKRRKRSMKVSHGMPQTEIQVIQKEIQRGTDDLTRPIGRKMSISATVDVSWMDGSFGDSFTSNP